MIKDSGLTRARSVVELGPGTGPITAPILGQIKRHTLFFALELNETHAQGLRARFPRLRVFQDSAENLRVYLKRFHLPRVDTVISSLPWTNMAPDRQEQILQSVLGCLDRRGTFVTFAYAHAQWLPRARQFRRLLRRKFAEVVISPIVWGNLPPAIVYRCRRPWAPVSSLLEAPGQPEKPARERSRPRGRGT